MRILALFGLLGVSAGLAADPLGFSSGSARVALIELYTSEGCSSCPAADQWLGSLRNRPGLWKEFVPVEFHVNYWNSLGWKDRLSSKEYTDREYAYSAAWGAQSVYTPCFVRNGAEWKPLRGGLFFDSDSPPGILAVTLAGDGICQVSFSPTLPAEDYVAHVALLGGGLTSNVTAGENRGATLKHEFVVIGTAQQTLRSVPGAATLLASLTVPTPRFPDVPRRALAAWVTRRDQLMPVQATGGWIP